MGDLLFAGRVSVDGGMQSITLIHDPSTRALLLSPTRVVAVQPTVLSPTPSSPPSLLFSLSRIPASCTVTSLILGRQADRRTLKPCLQRAFPIFHLQSVPGERIPSYILYTAFFFPRSCRNKIAATVRIDASRCKFVLFFIPRRLRRLRRPVSALFSFLQPC